MFVDWVVFFFSEIWDIGVCRLEDTLMIVDGHVGKVFCRTGLFIFLKTVFVWRRVQTVTNVCYRLTVKNM